MLKFVVYGIPRPQGSKRGFYRNGRVVLVEASKQLPEWRGAVIESAKLAALESGWVTCDSACRVEVTFFLPKPKTVKRQFPIVPPDADKLLRAVFDSLTAAKVVSDDSVICDVIVLKRYADSPGAVVTVMPLL